MSISLSALRVLQAIGLLLVVAACAPRLVAPVEERKTLSVRAEMDSQGGQHIRIAQPGDTLHGISFAAGLDVNAVAAWNNISDTSKLHVGQRVRLTKPVGFVAARTQVKAQAKNKVTNRSTKPKKPKQTQASQAKPSKNVVQTSEPKPTLDSSPKGSNKTTDFRWPVTGKLLQGFNLHKAQQGIDIQAALNSPVRASSAGEVVYVGNSLKGYGNLIIVKHNAEFLSAYAHNQKTLVKEGQAVSSQAVIGSVSKNKHKVASLHFQIRKNGQPVDPLNYLPRR